jgi:hypothetical protein
MPKRLAELERRRVEWFIIVVFATQSADTASNCYRALQSFVGWAEEEDEVPRSPMAKMKAPTVPVRPVPVLRAEQPAALFQVVRGERVCRPARRASRKAQRYWGRMWIAPARKAVGVLAGA